MDGAAQSESSSGTVATRGRRRPRRISIASAAAAGRTPPPRRSLTFGAEGPAAMPSEEEELGPVLGNLECPEGVPGVSCDHRVYLDPCGQPLQEKPRPTAAEDIGCATASNLFGGKPEQSKGPNMGELEDPVDIHVDVIHVFAREGGGLNFGDTGRADAAVPARGGRYDDLDIDDLFQAYTGSGFMDDLEYTIDISPRVVFFIISLVSLVVLVIALLIVYMVTYIRFYF